MTKNLPCTQCHEKVQMKQPNRIMVYLLKKVFRINCTECQRHWLYDEYMSHKQRGQCRRDPHADNNINSLANAVDRKPTIHNQSMTSAAAAQAMQSAASHNIANDGSHLQYIYVLERDSKFIYQYDLVKKVVYKRSVNMQTSYQHNFAYVQTPSDKLFLIGGGDI